MKLIPLLLIGAVIAPAQNAGFPARTMPASFAQPNSFDCSADGTVLNAVTGEPILRAHVTVIVAGSLSYSAITDASGKWALSNMGCAPGQLNVTRPGFLQNQGTAKTNGPEQPLRLTSGTPVHDLRSELTPQSVAVGKVLDEQGDPIMGVDVTAMALHVVDGQWKFQQAGSNASNDLGEYRIAGLTAGKYIFCARDRPRPAQLNASTAAADSCSPGPLEGGAASALDVPAGRESTVDFTMTQVPVVRVRVSVTGLPEGRSAGVTLRRREANFFARASPPGTIRGDNRFEFRVTPGSYTASADYFEPGKRLSARVPVEVGTTDIDDIELHVDGGFTVTGTVRVDSEPAQNALSQMPIFLKPSDPAISPGPLKWNNNYSAFEFDDVLPGSYRLEMRPLQHYYVKSATLAGQDILNTDVPISDSAAPIQIVLGTDGGTIDGDVADAGGQPVAAGILLMRDSTRVASATAQAGGHFKMQNVPPGDYTIYAWNDLSQVPYADAEWMRRNASAGMPVTVTASQSVQVKLTRQTVPQE